MEDGADAVEDGDAVCGWQVQGTASRQRLGHLGVVSRTTSPLEAFG